MHYQPFLFSAICKCAYTATLKDPNRPVFLPIRPSNQNQLIPETRATSPPSTSTSSPRGDRVNPVALITRSYDNSTRSYDQTPSPPKVKRGKLKRRVTIASTLSQSSDSSVDNSGGVDESDWPPFADEDYIVFCFEEDGEFHVVTEDSSGSQDCSDHSPRLFNQQQNYGDVGNLASPSYQYNYKIPNHLNRRDCLLPNKAVEEERFYFSPRLQSDGIKSCTRFKEERDSEEIDIVKARGRVEEDRDCAENMAGIKCRGEYVEEDDNMEDLEEDLDCQVMSIEYSRSFKASGSSSESDNSEQQHQCVTYQAIGLSFPRDINDKNPASSKDENNSASLMYRSYCPSPDEMVDEEDSVYLSSESQQNGDDEDDRSNHDEDSWRGSAEMNKSSQSEVNNLSEEDDEMVILSIAANHSSQSSDSTRSSFEFPVLQCEWIDSPVTWPKSRSIHFKKRKSRRVCLRCCKF